MSKKAIWIVALLLGFGVGGVGGFFLGALSTEFGREMFTSAMSSEQPADIGNPKSLSRKLYSVTYPGNWVENVEGDSDPEYYTSLDSPGVNYIQFTVFDTPIDTATYITDYEKTESNYVKNATKTKFSTWGKYKGHGLELKGRVMGINKGGMRIFAYSNDHKSFAISEAYYDEDEANVSPGFDLIEKTFRLK